MSEHFYKVYREVKNNNKIHLVEYTESNYLEVLGKQYDKGMKMLIYNTPFMLATIEYLVDKGYTIRLINNISENSLGGRDDVVSVLAEQVNRKEIGIDTYIDYLKELQEEFKLHIASIVFSKGKEELEVFSNGEINTLKGKQEEVLQGIKTTIEDLIQK